MSHPLVVFQPGGKLKDRFADVARVSAPVRVQKSLRHCRTPRLLQLPSAIFLGSREPRLRLWEDLAQHGRSSAVANRSRAATIRIGSTHGVVRLKTWSGDAWAEGNETVRRKRPIDACQSWSGDGSDKIFEIDHRNGRHFLFDVENKEIVDAVAVGPFWNGGKGSGSKGFRVR